MGEAGADRTDVEPLRPGSNVRLLNALGNLPAGAVGTLLGFFRYPHGESCLVAFGETETVQIPPGSLEQV